MSAVLPPSPVDAPFGSFNWADWYEKIRRLINQVTIIAWSQIADFTGSNLNQLATRLHNSLQSIQGGNGTTEFYHLTNADFTGTGTSLVVRQTTPTLITPILGTATATTVTGSKDATSFNTTLLTTAGFNGFRANNELGSRRLEIIYVGSTGGTTYGVAQDNVVYNASQAGGHNFSVSDAFAASIKAAGITTIGDITTGSTTLHKTSVALTNGAAAAAGTLLNAPVAGNPTKWVPINDNGTVRFIPTW